MNSESEYKEQAEETLIRFFGHYIAAEEEGDVSEGENTANND